MGEYGREQKNQLSRAVANSETGNKQLKGFVDNRLQNPQQLNSVSVLQLCKNMLQMNSATAETYSNIAYAIRQHTWKLRDFDSFPTFAVNKDHFAVCGGFNLSTLSGSKLGGKEYISGTSGQHAEKKLLSNDPDTTEIGVSTKICSDCLDSIRDQSTGTKMQDACSQPSLGSKYYYTSPGWVHQ